MRDDMEFNIELCELIKQYPALYDHTSQDYCIKSVQDRIWRQIAAKIADATDQECKDRWKNVRNRYAKYKKILSRSSSSSKPTKAYYLAPYLKFLDNYLKSRPDKGNFNKQNEVNNEEGYSGNEDDDAEKLSMSPSHSEPESKYILPISPLPLKTILKDDFNKSACDYIPEKKRRTAELLDTDLAFLQSMLPDMRAMTPSQKRKFKIAMLQLSNRILDDTTSQDGSSSWRCD